MPANQTFSGHITRVYYSRPEFSAGVVTTDAGERIVFKGAFAAVEGEHISAHGKWVTDKKYGRQFSVEKVDYDIPASSEGLIHYLATNKSFHGVGETTARKLVDYAGSLERLDELLRSPDGTATLHQHARIPMKTLAAVQNAWQNNARDNRIRTYLAGFGLTPHQIGVLLEQYADSIVGILKRDPYRIISHVAGFGFKRADAVILKTGVAKDHPGRIRAGLAWLVGDEIDSGHTWISAPELIRKGNDLLLIDSLDSIDRIRRVAADMVDAGELAADGEAITLPAMLDMEQLLWWTFRDAATQQIPSQAELPADYSGLNHRQAMALRNALTHRISVISGGAGTGKTHVVARVADALSHAGLHIALCAPTGKAAKRIEEVMHKQYGIAGTEAFTIHRLLRYDGRAYNRASLSEDAWDSPVFDAILVDEASMVDIPLMAEIVRRIDFVRTRLILVGDHNQLPPVGPGNLLRDIITHGLAPTVVLDEVVRQAGVLKANSSAVLSGVLPATADSSWVVVDHFRDALDIQAALRELIKKHIPDTLGLDPVRDVQIVTPTHRGALGTAEINKALQFLFHGNVHGQFAVGDKVIQTVNDYDLNVMNGSMGIVAGLDDNVATVQFEGMTEPIPIEGEKRKSLRLAYAVTAHKAQGSEYPCVVVVCHKSHFFADRNWLYTAVTRAARHVVILGDAWGLRNAAKKNDVPSRRTFLSLWASREKTTVHKEES